MLKMDRYAYAVGRIKVMETRLLDRDRIERMVEAKSADEALKVLGESEYSDYLAELADVYEYEKILYAELLRIYRELRRLSPEEKIIAFFARKYDYHNLKVLFKAAHLKEQRPELLLPGLGNIPLDELVRAVSEEDFRNLPPQMQETAQKLAEKLESGFDPQLVDLWLDQALFKELAAEVQRSKIKYLQDYFSALVDLTNIKTFLRVRRMQRAKSFLAAVLLPGGSLDLLAMLDLTDPLEVIVDRLASLPYAQVVAEGVQLFQQTGTLTRYEKLADNFLLERVRQAKYVTLGPEPVIGYLLAKENEIKIIRIVLTGKINRLPVAEIRERLRDAYV
ncbi:MAG TPA: V-type ATP synthase subunit C [Firmicutes bacterium]|nr:V-type ATP synthase subunit C [Bacillota bacterium]